MTILLTVSYHPVPCLPFPSLQVTVFHSLKFESSCLSLTSSSHTISIANQLLKSLYASDVCPYPLPPLRSRSPILRRNSPRAHRPFWVHTHLDSSPVASTPKCSHTAGQNCSRHVIKSSSRLGRGGNEPGPRPHNCSDETLQWAGFPTTWVLDGTAGPSSSQQPPELEDSLHAACPVM